jgi:phosphoenolpyruvate synthase/pyruvate phosphate dikinase
MSSKKQTSSWHGKAAERKSGLSGHYREIGIKSVVAATRKASTASPRARDAVAVNRKRNNTEGGQNE